MEQGDVVDQLYFVYHGELVSIPVTHQFVYLYIFLYMSFSNSDEHLQCYSLSSFLSSLTPSCYIFQIYSS